MLYSLALTLPSRSKEYAYHGLKYAVISLSEAPRFWIELPKERALSITSFADDIVLISDSPEMAHSMLDSLSQRLNTIGLKVNTAKTLCMSVPKMPPELLPGKVDSENSILVLGRVIGPPDSTDRDFDYKLKLQNFWGLRSILRERAPILSGLRIFNATVSQTVLWGAASWHLTRRRLQKNQRFPPSLFETYLPATQDFGGRRGPTPAHTV